jgi:hypothetical protein
MEAKFSGFTEHRRLDAAQPKLVCLACWPAYAGLLTSIGLGFLISVRYLLPLTVAFLVLVVATMLFSARDRRGYGPFALAVFGASGVLMGKFVWDTRPAVYGAIGLLGIASVWNTWPRGNSANLPTTCSDCRREEIKRKFFRRTL